MNRSHQRPRTYGQELLLELSHSSYDGRKSSYLHDRWNTPRASVQRISLKNRRVIGACDMRDFSLWSPCVHCFWLVARRSLDGGPGVSPHLTSRRDRGGKGQGKELNLYVHVCRGCSSSMAPPSVMSQPEAVLVRNPKTAIPLMAAGSILLLF